MNQHQQPNMEMGSGLTRYRSAPSSYFSSFLNSTNSNSSGFGPDDFEQLFNPRASSPETQRIFSRFMNNSDSIQENCSSEPSESQLQPAQLNSQFLEQPKKMESDPQTRLQRQQSNDFSSVSHMMYQTQNHEPVSSAMDNSYHRLLGSNRMEQTGSGLIRHSSSPAGLFANIDIERELGAMRGMGRFGGVSSGMMAPISEIESKDIEENIQGDNGQFDEFPINSRDDSALLSDNFPNGLVENETKPFSNSNALNDQNADRGNRPRTLLSHHLSLPKNSSELSAVENFLQDSVPCKIRAKRGCATHPRSIAERVRRTKISQRMRKLQELVPNMEK